MFNLSKTKKYIYAALNGRSISILPEFLTTSNPVTRLCVPFKEKKSSIFQGSFSLLYFGKPAAVFSFVHSCQIRGVYILYVFCMQVGIVAGPRANFGGRLSLHHIMQTDGHTPPPGQVGTYVRPKEQQRAQQSLSPTCHGTD